MRSVGIAFRWDRDREDLQTVRSLAGLSAPNRTRTGGRVDPANKCAVAEFHCEPVWPHCTTARSNGLAARGRASDKLCGRSNRTSLSTAEPDFQIGAADIKATRCGDKWTLRIRRRRSRTARKNQKDGKDAAHFGLRFARIRWSVRRCMFNRRAVSETLRSHCS